MENLYVGVDLTDLNEEMVHIEANPSHRKLPIAM